MERANNKKIWIDLDNSPHVPFFRPIKQALERKGYEIFLTARDSYQTCSLADYFGLKYKKVGKHYGKNIYAKLFGTGYRVLQLFPTILKEKPRIALSHGSRAQIISANLLRVPSVVIIDYEYAKMIPLFPPKYLIIPSVISKDKFRVSEDRIFQYPGIKEDVYAPEFHPDGNIKKELGINGRGIVVTVRPPAVEAHYFVEQSERLFEKAIEVLKSKDDVKMIILPRNEMQKEFISKKYQNEIFKKKIIIPDHAIDGLNLLWHSDLVISGGGTMNREAAALNVPVYSIFRGKIGNVDKHLSETGRLTLIEKEEDLEKKIIIQRRDKKSNEIGSKTTLDFIVDKVEEIMKGETIKNGAKEQ